MRAHRRTSAALLAAALVVLAPAAHAATLIGTSGPDVLEGTDEADRIEGRGGDDTITGLAGHDTLYGQGGHDSIDAGDGPDDVGGGTGADLLKGGYGADRINAGAGDTVWAGPDGDEVVARAGAYVVHGGPGPDAVVSRGVGRQELYGDSEADELRFDNLASGAASAQAFGGAGDDFVTAYPADPEDRTPTPVALLSGGDGHDSVTGFARLLDGGTGDDHLRTYEIDEPLVSTIRCGAGVDSVTMDRQHSGPLDEFGADCELIEVWIWTTSVPDQVLEGTPYADQIRTFSGAVAVDDTIRSLGGDDHVQGDAGSDTAYLGAGDDYYSDVGSSREGDVDTISCGAGLDTVDVYRADEVAADCEYVEYWD